MATILLVLQGSWSIIVTDSKIMGSYYVVKFAFCIRWARGRDGGESDCSLSCFGISKNSVLKQLKPQINRNTVYVHAPFHQKTRSTAQKHKPTKHDGRMLYRGQFHFLSGTTGNLGRIVSGFYKPITCDPGASHATVVHSQYANV